MKHTSIAALALVAAVATASMASAQSRNDIGAGGAGLGAGTSQMAPPTGQQSRATKPGEQSRRGAMLNSRMKRTSAMAKRGVSQQTTGAVSGAQARKAKPAKQMNMQ
jgi:hypothetical protein